MEIEEVVDRETLKEFLNSLPDEERHQTGLRLAFRAAARALPISFIATSVVDDTDILKPNSITVFGALSISGVAQYHSLPKAGQAVASLNMSDQSPLVDRALRAVDATSAAAAFATLSYAKGAVLDAVEDASGAISSDLTWKYVRRDLLQDGPLWPDGMPSRLEALWLDAENAMMEDDADWSIWIRWYNRILEGRQWHPREMASILSGISIDDWNKGPRYINPMFDNILRLYLSESAPPNGLSAATPVDFTFDTLHRVMRMIGIDDNMRHLRDPPIVQAFLDDAEQLRDGFRDFVDFAKELSPGGNYAGVLRLAADKILDEFSRVEDLTHLRAERMVLLSKRLEDFSVSERSRADLDEPLSNMLDDQIGGLKTLCRKHFGPSYQTLAPLADLTLEHVDQEGVLRLFDEAIATIERLPNDDTPGLDHEGMLVLQDMQNELRRYRTAIAEASTEDFKTLLEDRFAQSAGASGLTLLRFFERSSTAYGTASRGADEIAKATKRVKTLAEIWEVVANAFSSGA